jgi:polysaccharide biosynthesis protein PslG
MVGVHGNGGKGTQTWLRAVGSRWSRVGAVAALTLILLLAAAGGAGAKVPHSFFGTVPWLSFQGADYAHLRQADIRNARTPFFWPSIEPAKGDFHWAATDQFVGSLAQNNVRVLPFLNGSPSWVTHCDQTECQRKPPLRSKKAQRSWKRFVRACVERYGRDGEYWTLHPNIPRVPITSLQIWNEPNNYKYFKPRAKPKAYAKLMRLARGAARSQDKHAKIVLAGMDSDPTGKRSMSSKKFLTKLYKARRAQKLFNAVAVHPYAPTIRNLKRQMSQLHKVVKRHHDNAQMWITEMGWGSAPPSKRWPLLKGVEGQKKMLKKAYRLLIHNRKRWHLKRVYWFMWRDASPDDNVNCSFCTSAGLFTYDFKPKPAWDAFLKIIERQTR